MARSVEVITRRVGPLLLDHFRQWSDIDPESGCWEWKRAIAPNGYGVVRDGKRSLRAHRRALELHLGIEIDRRLDVCHRCDNRACVNPDHLFIGTRADNMADCAAKGRIVLPGLSGTDLPQSKLNESLVQFIRGSDLSSRALARELGVDRRSISLVRQRITWKHVK